MSKRKTNYRAAFRREWEQILADIASVIYPDGGVVDNQDRLFNLFGDAYERGYCGSLRHRQYIDSGRRVPIHSKPSIHGDTIVTYALKKRLIRQPTENDEKVIGTVDDNGIFYWWSQFDRARLLWDAWSFAWHKLKYKHSCYRRYPTDPIPVEKQGQPQEFGDWKPRVWEY